MDITSISVHAELERMGWSSEPAGDTELRVKCPAHEDSKASATMNVEKRLWKCHAAGCGVSGDIITFMALALKTQRAAIVADLSTRYSSRTAEKTVSPEYIERAHSQIWSAGPLLQALRKRGVSDAVIRGRKLGFDSGRITIPIYDKHKSCVNVRKYLPGAPGPEKMRNLRGHGAIRLYPLDQLEYDRVVITGGEMKAIVASEHLNPLGWGCITCTAGEGNWEPGFTPLFKDKIVCVIMDVDEPGVSAANKIAAQVRTVSRFMTSLVLPLDRDKYPHGDINDYFGEENGTGAKLVAMIDALTEWALPYTVVIDEKEPSFFTLPETLRAESVGRKVKTRGAVQVMEETPYFVAKTVACECNRDQVFCALCPVYARPEGDKIVELTISPLSPAILEMVNAGKQAQHISIRDGLRMPACKAVTFHVKDHYRVQQVHVTPALQLSSADTDSIVVPVTAITDCMDVGVSYDMVGRMLAHPRTQQAVLLCSESTAAEDALQSYCPEPGEAALLSAFRPKAWTVEAISEKLDEIYCDLENNVTRVFMRQDLHLIIDLAYHSVLCFNFDGVDVNGWAQVLVVGDSAQGKTETTKRMMEHYGLGQKIECKNASAAGLIGGLAQYGAKWLVTRGMIPRSDRQLVVLEELKGLSTEIIAKMTDMRSTGVAEIEKIEKRRMFARTRIIAISNPRADKPVASHSYGVEAIRELIGGPEDVRRFDAALVISTTQVPPEVMNRLAASRPTIPHTHKTDACRRCVLWAWTRRPEQVTFEPEAISAVLQAANNMCSKYVDDLPLVDRGSMRHKLARLSVALACRTFSTTGDPMIVLVREAHVKYVAQALDRWYSDPVFGYAAYSDAVRLVCDMVDVDDVRKKILATPFPLDLVLGLSQREDIDPRDVADLSSLDRDGAQVLVSFLVRKRAIARVGRHYRKNPEFIKLLKVMSCDNDTKGARPSYIEEL